jgi:hypothetical protein
MSSKNSKKKRQRQSRLLRAREYEGIDTTDPSIKPPPGAVLAEENALLHNNTYGRLPRFYVDKIIVCRECGREEIWPAERQKWWYEVAKGNIHSMAVLCRSCREVNKKRKDEARRIHMEGLRQKRQDNET